MMKAKGIALALTAAVLASPAAAQSPKGGIEGVWKVSKVVITGANPMTLESPQQSVWIFSRGYYSSVSDTSRTGRTSAPAAKDPAKPSDAEKLARYEEWASFGAQAGTYHVKGNTLIRHPVVAKNLAALTPSDQPAEIKLSGKTLVVTSQSPAGQPPREQTLTLTRLR